MWAAVCFQGKTYKCGFHPSLFSSTSAKFGCSLVPYDSSFYVLSKVYHCYMQEDLSDVALKTKPSIVVWYMFKQ